MHDKTKPLKIALIGFLIALVSVLHYGLISGKLELHLLYRELYFIPILLSSFWFGLKFGVATSLVISLIYAPHIYVYKDPHSSLLMVSSHIFIFNLMAIVFGWLTDRQKQQHDEVLAAEKLAILGRASIAIGHEMRNILGALKRISHRARGLQFTELDDDFEQEMTNLERMVGVLSSFAPIKDEQLFSHDINEIIRNQIEQKEPNARKAGVVLAAHLDERGCPSRVNREKIGWITGQIIKNAIEVSAPGQTIHIDSERSGDQCQVQIRDEGPGIKPELLPKIFSPFFTTKEKGHGLALAGCRQILRDMGGDILVASELGEGATFNLTIPREYSGKPLAEDAFSSMAQGKGVSHLYRE